MNIWVYIDHFQGKALPASWEAIGAAVKLGADVKAVVLGSGVAELAQEAIAYGADEVFVADDASLKDYQPEAYAATLSQAAAEKSPDAIFFPTTTRGRELAGMAAVDLKTGVLVDVVNLEMDGDRLVAIRPIYAGKLLQKAICKTDPQIVTLRGRAFPKPEADASRSGVVTSIPAAAGTGFSVVGYETSEEGVSLTDAGVIVSGGRGTSNNPNLTPPDGMSDEEAEIWRAQQGFKLIGELAGVLGGAVGASRAAVDAGYIPYSHQVGQTGKVVTPDLYVACGISGAIQHLAGMRNSKIIVAINKDPDAPIFKVARYGVVGDLFEVVPALSEAFKKKLGK